MILQRYFSKTVVILGAALLALALVSGNALADAPNGGSGGPNAGAVQEMIEWMGPENWGQMIQRMTQIHGAEWTSQMLQQMNEDGTCHDSGFGSMMGRGFGNTFGRNGMMGWW